MNKQDLYDLCHSLFSYDDKTGVLYNRVNRGRAKAGDAVGSAHASGCLQTSVNNKRTFVHHIVWLMNYGHRPEYIRHRNGDTTNNRLDNLLSITRSQTQQGGRGWSKLGLPKGVRFDKSAKTNPYRGIIGVDGKKHYLGCYPTPELAQAAYEGAGRVLHGEHFNAG